MSRLTDTQFLAGQLETITAMDLRRAPGDALTQVTLGKIFLITRNGKVVARLCQPEPTALELGSALRRSRDG